MATSGAWGLGFRVGASSPLPASQAMATSGVGASSWLGSRASACSSCHWSAPCASTRCINIQKEFLVHNHRCVRSRRRRRRSDGRHSLLCRASWEELAGVLVFSAFPFTIVKIIANSSLGKVLQDRMQAEKNLSKNKSLEILSEKKKAQKESYEILHARWAMLAALGVVIPELLDHFFGVAFAESVWWRVGLAKLQGDTLDYFGIPGLHIAGAQGIFVIALCQFLLMVGPEYARYCGIEALEPLGVFLPGDINYPGGKLFDPLGLARDPVAFEDLKVKEIKNGRLAMVAWLGFYAQAAVTGQGPIQNLLDYFIDPVHNNLVTYASNLLNP